MAYLEHMTIHVIRISTKPPVRVENIRVVSKYRLVAMDHSGIHPNMQAAREPLAGDFPTFGRHHTGQGQTNTRVHTHAFLAARVEVNEL